MHRGFRIFSPSGLALVTVAISACSGGPAGVGSGGGGQYTALCQELRDNLIPAAPKDGIPALTDPPLLAVGDPDTEYLLPTDRVIGLEVNGEYIAVPHNILWYHEIANFNDLGLAVTFCPLTGSSMVFRREVVGGAEFGVSGFLFKNNLVMYDRGPDGAIESLWPQMIAGARCGPAEGLELSMYPAIEIEWEDWVALHPDTRVLGTEHGRSRDYTVYPYGDYEREDNEATLFPLETLDPRRPAKERVLGLPFEGGGGIAFPFGALRSVGDLVVIQETLGDPTEGGMGSGMSEPVVVFWDSEASAAMAFRPWGGNQDLTFEVTGGAIVDLETGSTWNVEGKAVSGPLAGTNLWMLPEAYVSFWFAFSTFYPDPLLWLP